MIDLHTHTLLSEGCLLPSELVRRYWARGYSAVAVTDHADDSNIESVVSATVRVARVLNRYWDILVIPGVELTHLPLERFRPLTKYARKNGARIVVAHGETLSEPVLPGTNRAAIEAGVDILAHPGRISERDAKRAKQKGVLLELTLRKNHKADNPHVLAMARRFHIPFILNSDAHSPEDIVVPKSRIQFLIKLGLSHSEIEDLLKQEECLSVRFR